MTCKHDSFRFLHVLLWFGRKNGSARSFQVRKNCWDRARWLVKYWWTEIQIRLLVIFDRLSHLHFERFSNLAFFVRIQKDPKRLVRADGATLKGRFSLGLHFRLGAIPMPISRSLISNSQIILFSKFPSVHCKSFPQFLETLRKNIFRKRIFLKFWGMCGSTVCRSCRFRQELSNEYLLAKFGVDIAENERLKFWMWFRPTVGSLEIWTVTVSENPTQIPESWNLKCEPNLDCINNKTFWVVQCVVHNSTSNPNESSAVWNSRIF